MTMQSRDRVVRVLHVEDDQFQQMTFSAVASSIGQGDSGLRVQVTTVETANAALEALEDGKKAFDLVLLDYLLPDGHNGDTVLPKMRKLLGPYAAIIMLSGDAQEAPMQRCWLDLGADSYRLKPVSRATVEELFSYTFEKRQLLQKRRRHSDERVEDDEPQEGSAFARKKRATTHHPVNATGRSRSVTPSRSPDRDNPAVCLGENSGRQPPAIIDLLANGRRGPVHLAFDQASDGEARGMKVYPVHLVRGPPPPPHPHVNHVYERLIKGEQCIELRALCDGGEFFDLVMEQCDYGTSTMPVGEVIGWFAQIVAAVAHCHSHGAVHGQLHPENVLLKEDCSMCIVTGFSCCSGERAGKNSFITDIIDVTGGSNGSGSADGSPLSDTLSVELRPLHSLLDAPELQGRSQASPAELAQADVYALGLLLTYMLIGRPEPAHLDPLVGQVTEADESETDVKLAGLPAAVRELGLGGVAAGSGEGGTSTSAQVEDATSGSISKATLVDLALAMLHADPLKRPTAEELLRRLVG